MKKAKKTISVHTVDDKPIDLEIREEFYNKLRAQFESGTSGILVHHKGFMYKANLAEIFKGGAQ